VVAGPAQASPSRRRAPSALAGQDADRASRPEQDLVRVMCADEKQQLALIERFQAEG
jgi:hypothetical protein